MTSDSQRDLRPLLDPQSIAIIGATPHLGRIGGIPLAALLGFNFPRDKILLVNPRYEQVEGIRCYPEIAALPFPPDLAILAVPAPAVVDSLHALDMLGVPASVIFAAGFGEDPTEQGIALDADLRKFLRGSRMAVAGPNTIGVANVRARTSACFVTTLGEELPIGPLALIGQSGNSVSMMAADARDYGIGMSYFVSTGNETGIEFSQYLEYFCADPETGAVLGYAEQLRDGPDFMRAAAALRAAGKPLFLAKVGRSEKAREATASHTGAMAGNALVHDAAFRQLGVGTGRDPGEVMDMARLWNTGARVRQPGICIVSLSGAGCAFLSDMCADAGIPVPTLPDHVQAALRGAIPSYGMVSNPVDLTGNVINDMNHLRTVLDALTASDTIDCILIYIMGSLLDAATPILLDVRARTDKLIIALDPSHARSAPALRAAGVEVFTDALRAVSSIAAYLRWASSGTGTTWLPTQEHAVPMPDWLSTLYSSGRRTLTEVEGKRLLAEGDISGAKEIVAIDKSAATAAAEQLGYPVVVKLLSPDILHKSDIGGVALGLRNGEEVARAAGEILSRARSERPDATIEGLVVQPELSGQAVLLGVTRDPTFGPVMTVGLGGVLTELYRDVSLRLLPIDAKMAHEMLDELVCAPLLSGFRGAPLADRDALVHMMVALSRLVEQRPWIAEIEINPVLVGAEGRGCHAVDALVRLMDDTDPQA